MENIDPDTVNSDANPVRTHTMFFQINRQDSFAVRDLSTSQYVSFKHDKDKAVEYVRNLLETGKVRNSDDTIETIFRSIDDVDYEPIMAAEDDANIQQESVDKTSPIKVTPKSSSGEKSKSRAKQPSAVWQYFEKDQNSTARCIICNKIYKHGGNTTNLFQHLSTSHAILCSQITKQNQKRKANVLRGASSDESVDDCPPTPNKRVKSRLTSLTTITEAFDRACANSFQEGGKAADKITNAILYMIAVDKMPLSTVQNEGFNSLMRTVAPLYSVPSRKTVTRLLDARYEVLKERFVATLNEAVAYSLTCDNWTDISNESYLGVTVHYVTRDLKMKSGCVGVFALFESHTSKYLGECIHSAIGDFGMDRLKITAIITDSAANIKKAVREYMGPDKHLACFAHTLSHLVPDVLGVMPSVRDIIAKVKAIVTVTRRSVVACDELKRLQIRDGKTEGTALKFIQDVPTRWNSTLYMLERFLLLEEYVYPAISKCPTAPDMLKRDEIQTLSDVVTLMKPLESVIKEVSGESYPTCSVIIPLVRCLKMTIQECKLATTSGNEFKEKLEGRIDHRFKDFELHKTLALSTFLDPRFKKMHFQNPLAVSSTVSRLNDYVKKDGVPQPSQEVSTSTEPIKSAGLWSFHDRLAASKTDREVHCEGLCTELKQYLSQPIISRHEDPLKYWSSMKHVFPSLYKLAIQYVTIVGTSVPCERLFSQAGDIKTDKRSRLTGEHLNKLLFLSSLAPEDWGLV